MKIVLSTEVNKALQAGKQVIALESTIIAHGMPYPENVNTAFNAERLIREAGIVPATIGIVAGEIVVGMSEAQIIEMAKRTDVLKVSRRDLAYTLVTKSWGATTVAATMLIAARAGIKLFVTGGIGGVHRGGELSLDISADLEELARTNVAVICAGPKVILDLDKTFEYLETKGVAVVGYNTTKMPAFYTLSEKHDVQYSFKHAADIAALIKTHNNLALNTGILIVNPIDEKDALPYHEVEQAIKEATIKMREMNVYGKEETPFLLREITKLTKGQSLTANMSLLFNNVKLGIKLALALQQDEN